MLTFDHLISLYAPFSCLGCGVEHNRLVCDGCQAALVPIPSRCYRCKATVFESTTCAGCRVHTPLGHVWAAVDYSGLAKELLHTAKYERARAGLTEMASLMSPLVAYAAQSSTVLVAAPTATGRVRQRGYDQAGVLAYELAKQTGLVTRSHLARIGQAHQVGAGRTERFRHLEGAFRAIRTLELRGAHVILVDDVLTTGATLEAAARTLKKAGARQVDAIVFAQA